MIPSKWAGLLIALGLGVVVGLGVGWKLWQTPPPPPAKAAPPFRQLDGSLGLEVKPDAKAKPAQMIPAGAKVERIVRVEVQPTVPFPTDVPEIHASGGAPSAPRPPLRIDLSLIRMPDQSRRVIASSPDGAIVGGVDIPVEDAKPLPKPTRWAAGGVLNQSFKPVGAFIDRDLGPFRLGAEVTRDRLPVMAGGANEWSARFHVGVRW